VVALGALVVALLRGMNVEPLASIDRSTYGAIFAAGILGACAVVVEFLIVAGGVVKKLLLQVVIPLWGARRTALKNLQTPRPAFVPALRYLKAKNQRRFSAAAPERNALLRDMVQSFLIEIDNQNYEAFGDAYYKVPNYVWKRLEAFEWGYQSTPVPEEPPWEYPKVHLTPPPLR
jgi:hypothetical protein